MKNKIWTREEIDTLLIESDVAVMRAIVRLYEMQTEDEKSSNDTHHKNSVGFSATDAIAGSSFAKWLLGQNKRGGQQYPPKSLLHPRCDVIFRRYCKGNERVIDRARRIVLKHSRQLVNIANGK